MSQRLDRAAARYSAMVAGDSEGRRRAAAIGLLSAALCLAPVVSHAADLPTAAPAPVFPVAVVPNWTGFYIGGHMGLIDSNARYNYSTVFSGQITNHTRIGRINGAAPGAFVGFNYQMGSVVVGVEGDVTFTAGQFNLNGPTVDQLEFSNAVYTASGRLGYLLTPSTLAYGKGGISVISLSGFNNLPPQVFHKTTSGTQIGAGIEQLITDNIAVRVEGDYTSGSNRLVINQGFDQYRPSFLWVTAGLSYKFDPGIKHPVGEPTFDLPNRYITHDPNWTSVWIGGDAGVSGAQLTRYDRVSGNTGNLVGPYNDIRFVGGALAGVDLQLGRHFVVGAAIDAQFLHSTFDDPNGVGLATIYNRVGVIHRISAVTGRLGYLVSPTLLVYGKGGPAQIEFAPEQDYFAAINPATRVQDKDLAAVQGGLGIETLVADHVALRVEGLYTRATRPVVIDGVLPAQNTLQPSTLTGTVGLVVKY